MKTMGPRSRAGRRTPFPLRRYGPKSVYATDINGDGYLDVVSASENDDRIAWYQNSGGNPITWAVYTISTIADDPQSVYAADVDGDGDMDVLSASYVDHRIA